MRDRRTQAMRPAGAPANTRSKFTARAQLFFLCVACAALLLGGSQREAMAAGAGAAAAAAPPAPVAVPSFWDPRRRPERPDLSRLQSIRFLTELDYPPFDYAGPDGNPAGFNVDLARLDLRRDQGRLHHPGAAVRHAARCAQRQSRRRGDRLDRADRRRRGGAPISPIPITARRRASWRAPTARSATCCRNCSRARRSRWSPAPRTRPI